MRPIVWFRADLRVRDNPALHRACTETRRGVVAVFVLCPEAWREHDWADVRVAFLRRTLVTLSDRLHRLGVGLLVRRADTFTAVPDLLLDLARRHECDALFFNREHEVNEVRRDEAVHRRFERAGLETRAFTDQVVVTPGALRTGAGAFYRVFTPFRRAWLTRLEAMGGPGPLALPRRVGESVTRPDDVPEHVPGFEATRDRPDLWPAGEREAERRLERFLASTVEAYDTRRDLPAEDGTSTLSPYLAVGAISARRCVAAAADANGGRLDGRGGAATWITELVWREFYRHVLVGFPRVSMHRAFRVETETLPWRDDDDELAAWAEGRTGYPIVDAGMRQLAETGWMHNRLRMITAMFLTKDLFIDWRRGERHFMRHLVDGDLASNNGGWQWSASTGTDAAPYFRIFNPTSQGRRFDPEGVFIRRWVSELRGLEGRAIHEPSRAGLFGGLDYPAPVVDHAAARARVLEAFGKARRHGGT